jgi:hypothetical protein
MKLLNNLVSFLLELAMLGAFAFWGFHAGNGTVMKWLLGIGIPVLVVAFWSIFMAPRSSHRIAWPWLPIISLGLFLLSAAALYAAGKPALAVSLAAIAVVNGALVFAWRQQ